jgi:phytoene/squalene synthetase
VIPLEGLARFHVRADSLEDEYRLRRWLRYAVRRRRSLSAEIDRYLDHLDEREAAA